MNIICRYLFWGLLVILTTTSMLHAEILDKIVFVKIAAPEQKAVTKTPNGKLQMVGVGDIVADGYKIVEIAKERIVLEKGSGQNRETTVVTIRDGKQSIQRITKKPGKQQPLYKVQ